MLEGVLFRGSHGYSDFAKVEKGLCEQKGPQFQFERFCVESGLRLSDCLEPIIHPKASTLEEVSQISEIGRCGRALKKPVRVVVVAVVVVVVRNLNPEHPRP